MIKGYTYINLSLFPVYVNDINLSNFPNQDVVGVQGYNSSQWMSYVNNSDLDNLHTLVRLSNDDVKEDLSNSYYSNNQLITDLFDIILTKDSEFRSKDFNESIDYMLRQKGYQIDLSTNRYLARFSEFHPQNNAIILIANPRSSICKNLVNKRKRLNECL